jgi:hypothetical protein
MTNYRYSTKKIIRRRIKIIKKKVLITSSQKTNLNK